MYAETVGPDLNVLRVLHRLPADHGLHYAAVVEVAPRGEELEDVGVGVVVSEEDESVHQSRDSMLGKLLINVSADEPLDVD